MATRYYLPSTGVADVNPAFKSSWNKTSEADRLKMVMTKISSSFATKTCSENSGASPYYVLNRQYVSDPIGAHDFTGCTYKFYSRCLEDNAKADFLIYIWTRVFSNDGLTLRFNANYGVGSTEFDDDNLINRAASWSYTGSSSSQNGDRLVTEIGIKSENTKSNLYTATMDFGDASGTDLPENETETTQYNPWIEFSHDIAPYVPPSGYVPKIIMIT